MQKNLLLALVVVTTACAEAGPTEPLQTPSELTAVQTETPTPPTTDASNVRPVNSKGMVTLYRHGKPLITVAYPLPNKPANSFTLDRINSYAAYLEAPHNGGMHDLYLAVGRTAFGPSKAKSFTGPGHLDHGQSGLFTLAGVPVIQLTRPKTQNRAIAMWPVPPSRMMQMAMPSCDVYDEECDAQMDSFWDVTEYSGGSGTEVEADDGLVAVDAAMDSIDSWMAGEDIPWGDIDSVMDDPSFNTLRTGANTFSFALAGVADKMARPNPFMRSAAQAIPTQCTDEQARLYIGIATSVILAIATMFVGGFSGPVAWYKVIKMTGATLSAVALTYAAFLEYHNCLALYS